jgi:hypothetical protein
MKDDVVEPSFVELAWDPLKKQINRVDEFLPEAGRRVIIDCSDGGLVIDVRRK